MLWLFTTAERSPDFTRLRKEPRFTRLRKGVLRNEIYVDEGTLQ